MKFKYLTNFLFFKIHNPTWFQCSESFTSCLKGAVMSKAPDTSCYRDGRDEEERHEDEKPEVVSPSHAVAHQHLEHQQQHVESHCDQHGFELHTGLPFRPVGAKGGV